MRSNLRRKLARLRGTHEPALTAAHAHAADSQGA
jgi:hypothetical protein